MEGMVMSFWHGRRVYVTGHTGFKGGWLSLYLHRLGAEIGGYALAPQGPHSLFTIAQVDGVVQSDFGDICDLNRLRAAITTFRPEIVFHLAAQPLVRESYRDPIETYRVNVMGSLTLLQAARNCDSIRSVVMVTTDKCYENKEWLWGYRETDRLGGYDPYSSSKACAELAVASWRQSYFAPERYSEHGVGIATVRAGNVIGGGDWSPDRLVPDIIRGLVEDRKPILRNPGATRPWQHVLDPLRGYLLLAQRLFADGGTYASAFNFGPDYRDLRPVGWIAHRIAELWGACPDVDLDSTPQPHEANTLRLDWSKASAMLGWNPQLSLRQALELTTNWYRSWSQGAEMREYSLREIDRYQSQSDSIPGLVKSPQGFIAF
jgi:CDP-glucose 4,6-dehydratase